jgi:hypothetical protein
VVFKLQTLNFLLLEMSRVVEVSTPLNKDVAPLGHDIEGNTSPKAYCYWCVLRVLIPD